ncbi:TetR/AcrR family transcriptional regulator [Lentzea sp. NPDC058450]|uniref:TetR/AcrR family transcriptional regulator n=1 Tax=Lentzea sp. NPDC058450 TaxID=3346505 RepID=UPI00364E5793
MTSRTRRTDALSRERIVEAAVQLLDADGVSGLTFRALAAHLATGAGAIYWHVANKNELLDAATDAVVSIALSTPPDSGTPEARIRAVALGLYEAIDRHAWLGAQLATQFARNPLNTVAPRIWESFGQQVRTLGVPEEAWFNSTSALVNYVLGAAGQNAANRETVHSEVVEREDYVESVASAWEQLDPDEYPFVRAVAGQLRDHDDQEQFLSGVDIVVAGVVEVHRKR